MEFSNTERPEPPLSLQAEHEWIEFCRHIPENPQLLKNEKVALRRLRGLVNSITWYNNDCGICSGAELVKFPLELSCITSKRGRTTLDPIETLEYIDTRLRDIDRILQTLEKE